MDKKKFKREIINLNDEQIKNIRDRLEKEKYTSDTLSVSIETLKKQIELRLSDRGNKMHLDDYEKQLERVKGNIKALEKQIRTRQVINIVPK